MIERLLVISFSLVGIILMLCWARRHPIQKGMAVPVVIGLVNYLLFYSLAALRAGGVMEVDVVLLNSLSRLKDLYTVFVVVGILYYER